MSITTIGQNTGDTFTGCEDTDVRDNGGAINNNYATDPTSFVSKYASGDYRTNLIRFPGLSNINATDVVSSATLYLKVTNGLIDPITISLRRMLRNWVVSEATGNIYSTGNSWTSVMGVGNGTDRSNTISCAVSVDMTTVYHAFTSAQFMADVQDMIANPGNNHGWDPERTDGADDTGYREFISSNGTDGSRPYLSVTHAAAGGGASHRLSLLGAG